MPATDMSKESGWRDPLNDPEALLKAVRERLEDDSDAYADCDLLARLYELVISERSNDNAAAMKIEQLDEGWDVA